MTEKGTVEGFAAVLQAAKKQALIEKGYDLKNQRWEVEVKPGRKYTKVNVGGSGVYMVVNETGEIFGIKGYGVIHKGHRYGTLETVDDWDWRGYTAVRKAVPA